MYLIDAYNLLHALWKAGHGHVPRDFGHARRWMVDALQAVLASEKQQGTIFFDGMPGRSGDTLARPNLRIIFTEKNGEADDAIRDALEHGMGGKGARVVTSDREIRSAARFEGVQVIKSESFAHRLLRKATTGGEPSLRTRHSGAHHGRERRRDILPPRIEYPDKRAPERPTLDVENVVGDMLSQVGDFEEIARDALSEPLPDVEDKNR